MEIDFAPWRKARLEKPRRIEALHAGPLDAPPAV
jgi:hypothetical protein